MTFYNRELIKHLHTNLCQADNAIHHAFISLLSLWAGFYLIGSGLIQEAGYLSLRVSRITTLIIAGPPILGGISYSLWTSMAASEYLMTAISHAYKHLYPKVYELDIEYLLAPPTFINVERALSQEASTRWLNWSTRAWIMVFTIIIALGSLGAIAHISYLLWLAAPFNLYILLISIVVGHVLWLRGVFVWIICVQASGESLIPGIGAAEGRS